MLGKINTYPEANSNQCVYSSCNGRGGCGTRPSTHLKGSNATGGTRVVGGMGFHGCNTRPDGTEVVGISPESKIRTQTYSNAKTGSICVIITPEGGENSGVQFVSPYGNASLHFDESLCARSAYLPKGYWFSVKVYEGQYLHVKHECLAGTCQCVYFLDYVPVMLRPCRLAALLLKYHLLSGQDMFVLGGLCRGFKVVDGKINASYSRSNYKSILASSMNIQMSDNVRQELITGNISRVFNLPKCVHAMGAVVRPDGRLRAITDCSRPHNSINSFMSETAKKFSFSRIEDTRELLVTGKWGCVVDISNAYRHVAVYPPHRQYLGFQWEIEGENMYFQDNSLCFGLRSAPSIFNSVSDLVVRLMFKSGVPCQGYLDDYFVAGTTFADCVEKQRHLVAILTYLGFKINPAKVTTPSRTPKYLGVVIDLERMRFRLPEEKISRAADLVKKLLKTRRCSRKDIEKLTGFLAHVSVLVKGGRTFCRRLYSLLKATMGKKRITLGEVFKADLHWWDKFLRIFEGHCEIFPSQQQPHHLFTDASGSGFGAWYRSRYLFGFWKKHGYFCPHVVSPPKFDDVSSSCINVKELWPVVAAFQRWGHIWARSGVLLSTDNTQVETMIITGRSRNITAMSLIRELFWICSIHQIDLRVRHIKTGDNNLADRLSRLNRNPFNVNVFGLPLTFNECCVRSKSPTSTKSVRNG